MPLWWDAFLRDTMDMEADEVGAYMMILGAMWTRKNCDLPNDPRKLSRIARVSQAKWKSRIGPSVLALLETSGDIVFSGRLRKEAVFVQITVTNQRCKRTKENPANLLKGLDWGLTAVKTADKPQVQPTQQPNNPTYKEEGSNARATPAPPQQRKSLIDAANMKATEKPKPETKPKSDRQDAIDALAKWASVEASTSFIAYRNRIKKPTTATAATRIAKQLELIFNGGGDPTDALGMCEERGWQSIKAEWYFNNQGQDDGISNNGRQSTNNGQNGRYQRGAGGSHARLIGGLAENAASYRETGARDAGDDIIPY